MTAGLCSQTHNPPELLTEYTPPPPPLACMTRPEHEVTNISSIQLESDANMMLHAIHKLELSLKNPSLGVDVLVLIRRYPDVFSNTSFARQTGQIEKSVNFNAFALCLVKMLQHFPDSMLRLDIKDTIQILEKHYKKIQT